MYIIFILRNIILVNRLYRYKIFEKMLISLTKLTIKLNRLRFRGTIKNTTKYNDVFVNANIRSNIYANDCKNNRGSFCIPNKSYVKSY